MLKQEGFAVGIAHTSVLRRAIKTLWTVLEEMDRMWIPVQRSWRLNERHCGALQGLNKAETATKYSDEQVLVWRRACDTPPPLVYELDTDLKPIRNYYLGDQDAIKAAMQAVANQG